ncbi:MAG: hypothetical protein P8H03_05425 [Emcibacteraceae bacterium]|nr:hypothetical protein [Emcibacteraceae bacterium]
MKNSLDPENAAQFIPIITQIEGDLSPEQITESDKFVSNWKTQETEISIIANKGLIRTYEHAGIKAPSN